MARLKIIFGKKKPTFHQNFISFEIFHLELVHLHPKPLALNPESHLDFISPKIAIISPFAIFNPKYNLILLYDFHPYFTSFRRDKYR